jgi:hypothetical protein
MAGQTTNTFWIGANILFDLETGRTTRVMLLVTREDDATIFKEEDARIYLSFVKRRATDIQWSMARSKEKPDKYVIRGTQDA